MKNDQTHEAMRRLYMKVYLIYCCIENVTKGSNYNKNKTKQSLIRLLGLEC